MSRRALEEALARGASSEEEVIASLKHSKKRERTQKLAYDTAKLAAKTSGKKVAAKIAAKGGTKLAMKVTAKVAAKVAVVAPPFSTIAAAVVGTAVVVGIAVGGKRRAKFLGEDEKLYKKLIAKYKKKSRSWRKKKTKKLLKAYNKLLSKGNKKTLFGRKKKKDRLRWKAKKAKLEMKLKSLYAAEYKVEYTKFKQGTLQKHKISPRQAKAERRVVKTLKRKQRESIDPRTSPFPLIAPGVIGITPKLIEADNMQSQQSDVQLIKLAKMPNGEQQVPFLQNDVEVYNKAVNHIKEDDEKKSINPLIIGIPLSIAAIGGAVLLAKKGEA